MRVIVTVVALLAASSASADKPAKRLVFPEDPAAALAQVCVSECGWSAWCCAAIHRTLRNKAQKRGHDVYRHMKAYSDNVFNRARTDKRAWVAWLSADMRKPKHWPNLPWQGRYKVYWARMLFAARRLWDSEFNPCNGEPYDWGTAGDRENFLRHYPSAVDVDCGPIPNHFLRVPRRDDD